MTKVLILTEGGQNIGFGHVTRMLAIYQTFEEKGIKPKILVKGDNSVKSMLKGADWEIFDWIEYLDELKSKFGNTDILLIDSYLAPKEIYEYLSRLAKVPAYYDDFGRIEYPCGVVINGNIHAELINYPENPCVNYLLGVRYLPMRKEFWGNIKKTIRKKVKNILITFGGEDLRNLTPKILKALVDNFSKLTKIVVVGKGFSEKTIRECEYIADENSKIIYYPDAQTMKNLMLEADIAISAGGQTLYELARVGVPTIAIIVADNQEMQVKVFFEKGFLHRFFYWDRLEESLLLKSIKELMDFSVRKEKSNVGRGIVNGKGAHIIVEGLIACLKK